MNQLGYYGKTPHRGDFVRFNLPQSFVKVWDDWLQHILVQGEQSHDNWSDIYHRAPAYRFVLSSGIAGNETWIGLLQPSQDKVGRRFPFCIAMSMPETALPCVSVTAQTHWFADAEKLMTLVLSADYPFDNLQQDLAALASHHEQPDPSAANPLTMQVSASADNISITTPSADAFQHALHTPAMLDAVLKQTTGEYSLWISCEPCATTTVVSGLPTNEAALALLTGDWQNGANTRLNTDALQLSIGNALPLFAHLAMTPESTAKEAAGLIIDTGSIEDDTGTGASTAEGATGIDDIDSGLPDSAEPSGCATDQDPITEALTPSADDWAALDVFAENSASAQANIVPSVEQLELDEDDLPEAPWET